MANVAFLGRLVASVEHDNNHSATTHEVEAVARTVMNPHFRELALDRLPVSEVSCLSLR